MRQAKLYNIILFLIQNPEHETNGYELDELGIKRDIGKNWFMNKVVDEWNKLR